MAHIMAQTLTALHLYASIYLHMQPAVCIEGSSVVYGWMMDFIRSVSAWAMFACRRRLGQGEQTFHAHAEYQPTAAGWPVCGTEARQDYSRISEDSGMKPRRSAAASWLSWMVKILITPSGPSQTWR